MSSLSAKSLPGLKDFSPAVMAERNYLIDILKQSFQQYAFMPLETPAMESLKTLMGNYGGEGDKLIFKVLNSGDFLHKTTVADFTKGATQFLPHIAEKGLRYDLTLPLARYVAQNRHNLSFPFKRYQIQPVWRADRPQKGRYREFYQCDIDVVGSKSLLHEAEMLALVHQVLHQLHLKKFTLQLNHRLLIKAIAIFVEAKEEKFIARELDKLDRIGLEKVLESFHQQGLPGDKLELITSLFQLEGTLETQLDFLTKKLGHIPEAEEGIKQLKQIVVYFQKFFPHPHNITINPTLARGMDYYTGAIFEIKVPNTTIGSIVGGGRYDNLTALFGLQEVSGIGLSFGLDRMYDILKEKQLFPPFTATTRLLLVPMEAHTEVQAIQHLVTIRQQSTLIAEIYPATKKLQKALTYAHKKNISWVAILGEREIETQTLTLKNMQLGTQKNCTLERLIQQIK